MKEDNKTKKQLVHELTELRSQNAALVKSTTGIILVELAVEESRRYAESIVETVREPLLVLDGDLKIISANRNFYRTFKVTPDETIGSFIYDLGNNQWDIPRLRELLEEVLPEKEAFDDFEVDHDFQDIGHKIMLLNARRIYRKDIGAKMILLAIEDITERKRLESILIDSEERYRRLFETASDGIVLLEKHEGNITQANPATEKLLGYTEKECIGNKLQDIGVVLDASDFQATMQNLNKSGIINYRNVKVETKSGQHIDTEIYIVDRTKLVQCNIRDITEHKQTQEALRESEALLHSLIDYMHDAMIILNWDGSILFANWAAARIIEFERPEEFVGHNMAEYLHPDSFQKAAEDLEAVKADKMGFPSEYQLRSVTGRRIWVESIGGKIIFRNASANLVCLRDITERRQTENEREKMLLWQQGVSLLQQSLLAPATLEEKLRAITDSIVSLFDADFCRIWLIQPGDLCEQGCIHADVDAGPHICRYRDRCLHLLASSGRYIHTDGTIHRRVPFGCYKIGRIASDDDHKFLTNDVQNDPRIHDREWASKLGLVSFAGYQLRVPGGKTMGVLALFAKHSISSQEDAVLDGLSSTIALVIQREAAEKSMRGSEEKHRLLFDNAGDAIFVLDAEARMLAVNRLACERLGYTHTELMSMTINQVDSPEEAPHAPDRMTRLMVHGQLTFETVHQRKDGSLIPTDVIARRIAWGGQPAIMSICRDITERKLAEEQLQRTLESLRKAVGATIQVMVSAVEVRDPYTAGHQIRSADLARAIAAEMGLPQDCIDGLRMAGSIHDIGKLAIPAEILSKPTRLTELEFSLIKEHARQGYEMLKDVESPWSLAQIVYQHHERMDGSGYPRHLKGDDILMEARIMAVADVVESMSSHRPYRPALGLGAALEEIEKNRGTLYDNTVVAACLGLFREKGFQFEGT